MILSATSEMTPRPNCAGRPVMVMSVTIVTAVLSGPSATIVPVTVALGGAVAAGVAPAGVDDDLVAASSRST